MQLLYISTPPNFQHYFKEHEKWDILVTSITFAESTEYLSAYVEVAN